MKAENAIEVKDIKKAFKIYYDKGHTLKEKLLFRNRRTYEERVVLDGISFEVKKGEAIGLIGQNGCGKSTTLKLLTKIMYPDTGSIEMRGRVSSLIELGAGFHPDMSGRENIYINASIFGLTRKEIEQRLNDIIAFSELEEYIDNPVRTYSSGMYMRLAFSVAINVDADILLIDEILAVGDAAFQAKCFNKLKEIKAKGTTIVIVSHSLGQIEQICERSIWIQAGKIKLEGTPRDVHPVYLQYMSTKSEEVEEGDKKEEKIVRNEENSNIKVNEIYLIDSNGNITKNVKNRDKIELRIEFNSLISKSGVIAGIGIFRDDGLHCYGTTTKQDGIEPFTIKKGINHMSVCFESMELLAGDYSIDWALAEENGTQIIYVKNILTFNVYSFTQEIGAFSLKHYWIYQEDTEKNKKYENDNFYDLVNNPQFVDAMRNKLSNTICVWGERSRLFIHENANMVNTLFNTNSGYIYIDEYTFTGHNVCILTGTHNIYRYNEERMDFPTEGNDIRIGKGVYIASNVTILGPCKVGDNAVIAAGAVVVPGTIIEENAVYAGVPAKLIKKLNE